MKIIVANYHWFTIFDSNVQCTSTNYINISQLLCQTMFSFNRLWLISKSTSVRMILHQRHSNKASLDICISTSQGTWLSNIFTSRGVTFTSCSIGGRCKREPCRTQCHKGQDLWFCNQLFVNQFCTSYWYRYLKIRSLFCIWFGNMFIAFWVKVRTNSIIRTRIMAKN